MAYTKTNWVNGTTPLNETNLNKIESGIKNNDINIGEENYDNTKTYEVGDIVRYNEKIYKCITAITTAENFDISKWEQTNIVEIVQSEKSKIYELIEAISTPIVGEGENITLNDTAEKRFEKFDIEGNSEQEATPSPDYPSEIKTVGSNVNLFDKNTHILVNSFETRVQTDYILLKKGTYTLNFIGADSFYLMIFNENKEKVKETDWTEKNSSFELDNKYYIVITFRKNNNIALNKDEVVNIKLVEGTEVGEYSKYGQGCVKVTKCNKNIFKETYNRKDVTSAYASIVKGECFLEKDKTYVVSFDTTNNGGTVYIGEEFFQYINTYSVKCDGTRKFFTVKARKFGYVIDITVLKTLADTTNAYNISNVMINEYENDTDTEYVEHKSQTYTIPTQQPMRAIGDIRDTFILKENGKWYERHYTYRKIFDGTESFAIKSQTEEYIVFERNQTGKARGFTNIICSHFKTLNSTTEECVRGSTGSSYVYINISKGRLSSMDSDGFKEWLTAQYNAGTPVYVDYVLEEPLDIECTSEQTEILNQIYIKAKSYKGVTHIYSNDAVSPNFYVEAVKDLTTLIK